VAVALGIVQQPRPVAVLVVDAVEVGTDPRPVAVVLRAVDHRVRVARTDDLAELFVPVPLVAIRVYGTARYVPVDQLHRLPRVIAGVDVARGAAAGKFVRGSGTHHTEGMGYAREWVAKRLKGSRRWQTSLIVRLKQWPTCGSLIPVVKTCKGWSVGILLMQITSKIPTEITI
jgi:hypothetical protein